MLHRQGYSHRNRMLEPYSNQVNKLNIRMIQSAYLPLCFSVLRRRRGAIVRLQIAIRARRELLYNISELSYRLSYPTNV